MLVESVPQKNIEDHCGSAPDQHDRYKTQAYFCGVCCALRQLALFYLLTGHDVQDHKHHYSETQGGVKLSWRHMSTLIYQLTHTVMVQEPSLKYYSLLEWNVLEYLNEQICLPMVWLIVKTFCRSLTHRITLGRQSVLEIISTHVSTFFQGLITLLQCQ